MKTRTTLAAALLTAALLAGGTSTATAAVGGPDGYVGTNTGPGIANLYVSQLGRSSINTTVDINVTGTPYAGKISSTLRKPNGTVLGRRTIDLNGRKVYQVAWGYDRTLAKGSKYYMTATVPAAYGHKAATLKSQTLTIK